ncbi:MAG TPA: LutB/LldF family L-lactate oxidation iron-sulfur protein [Polyangiaceae bacterium]|jgi:L-lactate dehydrogenase complex protein LldF|nr:LutB/LldF family L-lactate oxidation iron-sulfur protein [Polyangiaceae bacterium]
MIVPASRLTLKARAARALDDPFLRKAVRITVERLRNGRDQSTAALGDWEEWRERGRLVRTHVVQYLDYYLAEFSKNLEQRGGHVHFARDAAEARQIVLGIARQAEATLAVKSKSMVSEEIRVNHELEHAGIECVETDLGEWIIQLADEAPSHLIIPAIHKNRHQVKALFEGVGARDLTSETDVLAGFARRRLRERFLAADLGISGCNFAIADSGSIALFTNEGNGRMVTTLPKTHVVIMGMERILPTLADLELMANLLPRSATGQKLTTYLNLVTGPRLSNETDGARDMHVVILDNGRSRQLGDPEFQDVLNCIRCGACLNVCPVYRQIGGHAYGSVYSGPIGAVLTPRLAEDEQTRELADASSLCGACFEACPVKIPLHDMLVHQRRRNAEARGCDLQSRAFQVFGWLFSSPRAFGALSRLGRFVERTLRRFPGLHWVERLPLLREWARHRALPVPAERSFRELFAAQEEKTERERRA